MSKPKKPKQEESFSKPERVVLVVARHPGGCRGKAMRVSDGAEFQFGSVEELAGWLVESSGPSNTTKEPDEDRTPDA